MSKCHRLFYEKFNQRLPNQIPTLQYPHFGSVLVLSYAKTEPFCFSGISKKHLKGTL